MSQILDLEIFRIGSPDGETWEPLDRGIGRIFPMCDQSYWSRVFLKSCTNEPWHITESDTLTGILLYADRNKLEWHVNPLNLSMV